jgi:glycosyltransferase A (GT-A) superfamily protein (DUF2064 family)
VSAEPWSVEFEHRAAKDLERLDPSVGQRVLAALERLAGDPAERRVAQARCDAPRSLTLRRAAYAHAQPSVRRRLGEGLITTTNVPDLVSRTVAGTVG